MGDVEFDIFIVDDKNFFGFMFFMFEYWNCVGKYIWICDYIDVVIN